MVNILNIIFSILSIILFTSFIIGFACLFLYINPEVLTNNKKNFNKELNHNIREKYKKVGRPSIFILIGCTIIILIYYIIINKNTYTKTAIVTNEGEITNINKNVNNNFNGSLTIHLANSNTSITISPEKQFQLLSTPFEGLCINNTSFYKMKNHEKVNLVKYTNTPTPNNLLHHRTTTSYVICKKQN